MVYKKSHPKLKNKKPQTTKQWTSPSDVWCLLVQKNWSSNFFQIFINISSKVQDSLIDSFF